MPSVLEQFYARPIGGPRDWVPRLVAPDVLREAASRPLDAGWSVVELALPLLHPAHHRGPSSAIASLLGLEARQLRQVVEGPQCADGRGSLVCEPHTWPARVRSDDDGELQEDLPPSSNGPAAVHAYLCALDPTSPPPNMTEEARQLLAAFAQAGVRPEWLAPTVVPLPPTRPALATCLADFSRLAQRIDRLVTISAPRLVIDSDCAFLQRRFDELFDALAPR